MSLRSILQGRRILIIEDVPPVAMMLEGIVHAFGDHVAARPETFDEAKRLARSLDFDAAVLVTEPWGEQVWPIAAVLRERQIPFVLAAPPDADDPPREWRRHPLISKPHRASDVGRALLTARRETRRTDAAL